MAWEIRWAPNAGDDLEKAVAYIAKDSPHYASVIAKKPFPPRIPLENWPLAAVSFPRAVIPESVNFL